MSSKGDSYTVVFGRIAIVLVMCSVGVVKMSDD